ncbi:Stage V sporulation protein B [Clostridium liquoris]|jgi:stage V sporulation protein B|uniref:Multidrug-efflux transporter n=1 Tax=Clostridium liquoris TaxID=1289519 RepID=A0A2T0B2Q2_9CLOT|nr:stage V sporulation protein B [Clostridium liquoris]PRR78168.1 Stage V sporulation protein B [Clostridium liquoris]
MKKDTFFRDSFILTLSNLTTGILGFTFSVILSHKLGAEGMGLYGLIMPIYNLFICLICGGMIAAISKVSAEFISKKDYINLNKTVDITIVFDIVWSLIIVFFVFINADSISKYIIKDIRAINAVKIICPAMIFIAISSILKGYFYGISKIKIPAFIDISEKSLRILFIIGITTTVSLNEIKDTVTIAYIALVIGEFSSTILLYLFYKLYSRNTPYSHYPQEGRAQLLFNVLSISFPLCLNGFLSTALSTVSTLLVPRRLVHAGFDYSNALAIIGKFTGMSLAIVFFPMLVVNSMSTILIPDISQSISNKNYWAAEDRIKTVLKISFLLGLSTMLISITIPDSLGMLFFKRNDLGQYILFSSLCAPFLYTSATTFGILNGLGKQGVLLRNSLIVSVEEIILLFILIGIPSINIYGYVLSLIITSITTLFLNIHEIRKNYFIDVKGNELIIIMLVSLLMYFILNILKNLLPESLSTFKYIIIIITSFSSMFIASIIIKKSDE